MSLHLLGISHHTAPISERERWAVPDAALPEALALLMRAPGVREALILSTCNRIEIVVEVAADAEPALPTLLAQMARQAAPPQASHCYRAQDAAAVRHLFRVAASLDSQIVGEPQILGQMKQAYAAAQAAATIGPELDALFPRAFHAAKRVRTETDIAQQPVSISQTAVDLARQIFGSLDHAVVLLAGAGAVGQETARCLVRAGASRLLIANRTLARAELLAAKFSAEAMPLADMDRRCDIADIVITCTGAGQFLVTRIQAAHWLARRRGRPMLFLDLAVPRDVEPEVHSLENAFVYNVDDLDQAVGSNLAGRRQQAEQGEAIVAAEVELYAQRRQTRDLAPTLLALQRHAETLRQTEWERVRKRLGVLTPEQEQAIEALTRTLMQKWLHQPMVEIKETARAADREALLEMIHRLFALPADERLKP